MKHPPSNKQLTTEQREALAFLNRKLASKEHPMQVGYRRAGDFYLPSKVARQLENAGVLKVELQRLKGGYRIVCWPIPE